MNLPMPVTTEALRHSLKGYSLLGSHWFNRERQRLFFFERLCKPAHTISKNCSSKSFFCDFRGRYKLDTPATEKIRFVSEYQKKGAAPLWMN